MTICTRDVVGVILGVGIFFFYVSNTRPVGWFDSVVGPIVGIAGFVAIK